MFHSNRIDEVVHAACDVAQRFPRRPLAVAGYSLGGNFALRLALRAPAAGLQLAHVAAVCPVLDPARTMDAMEHGLPLYLLVLPAQVARLAGSASASCFPSTHRPSTTEVLGLRMRPLTQWLVERHTDFGTLERYFDGYSIAGERLAGPAGAGQHPDGAGRSGDPGRRLPCAAPAGRARAGDRRPGAGIAASWKTRGWTVSPSAGWPSAWRRDRLSLTAGARHRPVPGQRRSAAATIAVSCPYSE